MVVVETRNVLCPNISHQKKLPVISTRKSLDENFEKECKGAYKIQAFGVSRSSSLCLIIYTLDAHQPIL